MSGIVNQWLSKGCEFELAMVTNAAFPSLQRPILALFLQLGQPSTLIRHENEALGKRALQARGIWKRRLSAVFVWT